jgi:16S rRNA (adenine1518-N6/adenine1519-N6)-dimethyltransferase
VVAGDALTTDMSALAGGPTAIVSNLPYNIGTPLLVGWLKTEPWPPWYRAMTLMFQREVAERIAAPPGSKTYGRLSVLAGWRTETRLLFDIDPRAFTPQPKVTSSLVHFEPRPNPLPCDSWLLERVTTAAFGQRRKMLRQSLRSLGVDPGRLLDQARIDETRRAEEIDIAGFVALARALGAIAEA